MPNLRKWSQTASGNASVAGGANTINWQEGQAPSTVNNSSREEMAQIRRVYRPDEWGWVECSATASVASQTTFKLAGDQTSDYTANRRVRLTGGSATVYGTITSASFTAETTVTITKDSGSLSASMSIAAVSSAYDKNLNTPSLTGNNSWTGTQGFGASVSFSAPVTMASNLFVSASVSLAGAFALSGDITDAITADQNDYAPTGHATASTIRVSSDANRTITGLAGGADGRIVLLMNVNTSFTLTLASDSASSTAANRFYTPGDVSFAIPRHCGVKLRYDATDSRWYVIEALRFANQSAMESASATEQAVSPGVQQYHPGHPKFWAYVTVSAGTPTLQTSYNVTSITDTATGQLTVTIATDFSSANWAPQLTIQRPNTTQDRANQLHGTVRSGGIAAGTILVECNSGDDTPVLTDPASWSVMGLGDQ